MKVTVVGTGYVGLVTGACLAELGNSVFCLDVDSEKIGALNAGHIPIFEPGLEEIVKRNVTAGRLTFSTDVAESVAHGDLQFIAVGTPPDEDGKADLQYVLSAAREIGRHMSGFKVVINKSTVPVGTAQIVRQQLAQELEMRGSPDGTSFAVVSNPEFLKEGDAIQDFMRPDRIILGVDEDTESITALEMMKRLYAPFSRNHDRIMVMNTASAELTKYAANAMLATRISFMNELANLAHKLGVDIEHVRKGIGSDPRIGYNFLYAGIGYGGSCFPKDVKALIQTASRHGDSLQILQAVESANERQKLILLDKVLRKLGPNLSGKTLAVWGLAFKPGTDDMREAPSLALLPEFLRRGARLKVHDPVALKEAKRCLSADLSTDLHSRIEYHTDHLEVLQDADALILATEWKAYRSPDFQYIKSALRTPLIFDGRNQYEPQDMAQLGIEYYGIGRGLKG